VASENEEAEGYRMMARYCDHFASSNYADRANLTARTYYAGLSSF